MNRRSFFKSIFGTFLMFSIPKNPLKRKPKRRKGYFYAPYIPLQTTTIIHKDGKIISINFHDHTNN